MLTACEAAALIAAGDLQSEALVSACLERIARRERDVRAWAHVDTEEALRAAREADKVRQGGARPLGPIHGVPIGIKDVIATKFLRTEYNSEIYLGHRAATDAAAVAMLRAAGAVIIGKTETVEFAAWGGRVARTGNPHDLSRTPGGSSSGSAAAVADYMVPLALATQTGGSTIRPAAYCGVVGYKPTFGTVSTEGVKRYAVTLDTLGWYARSVEDAALLARVFEVSEGPIPEPPPAKSLRIGMCRTPYWDVGRPETQAAFLEAGQRLSDAGAEVKEIELGTAFSNLNEMQRIVMWAEGRVGFSRLAAYGAGQNLARVSARAWSASATNVCARRWMARPRCARSSMPWPTSSTRSSRQARRARPPSGSPPPAIRSSTGFGRFCTFRASTSPGCPGWGVFPSGFSLSGRDTPMPTSWPWLVQSVTC